jgi:hypothetical protein
MRLSLRQRNRIARNNDVQHLLPHTNTLDLSTWLSYMNSLTIVYPLCRVIGGDDTGDEYEKVNESLSDCCIYSNSEISGKKSFKWPLELKCASWCLEYIVITFLLVIWSFIA